MNILYISNMPAMAEAGPSWSVPAGVKAQSEIDNVLWINTKEDSLSHWREIDCFHVLSEYGNLSLRNLPRPFNKPDVVVFEGMYDSFKEITFSRILRKFKIPYVIIPRGSLTYLAMHNGSRIKKALAHKLFYDKYIEGALAIQYLTNREYEDSKYRFNGKHFIIPNGIYPPSMVKKEFSDKGVHAVFIGRFDAFHKGLDLLIEACKKSKDYLLDKGFQLSLYGTETSDWFRINEDVCKWGGDFIHINSAVVGKEKEAALLSGDVFVMTSRFEGHPMGLIEALAYGLPCLVSDGTNMADYVAGYNAGWICKADVNSISNALHSLMDNNDTLREKGDNALKLSLQYNWSKLAMDFHNQIEKLLG